MGVAGTDTLRATKFLGISALSNQFGFDFAGLFGAHSGRPGGCLTIGTGVSFAWWNESGVVTRRGGFGFVLGDQGGGAWIGQRLLCGLIRLADRGDLLPSHINLIESLEIGPTPNDWITFANQASPSASVL